MLRYQLPQKCNQSTLTTTTTCSFSAFPEYPDCFLFCACHQIKVLKRYFDESELSRYSLHMMATTHQGRIRVFRKGWERTTVVNKYAQEESRARRAAIHGETCTIQDGLCSRGYGNTANRQNPFIIWLPEACCVRENCLPAETVLAPNPILKPLF